MTGPGRPRQVDDEAIFTVALEAFGSVGYDAVSLRDLNRTLGVSHGMLARRFGDKDRLWEATVRWGFGRHQARLLTALTGSAEGDDPADDLDRLRRVLREFVATAADLPDLHRVVTQEACRESPRVDTLFEIAVAPLFEHGLRDLLDRLERDGRIRHVAGRDAFFLVANGAAAVFAMAPLSRRFDAADGPVEPAAYADRVADLLLSAVTLPGAGQPA